MINYSFIVPVYNDAENINRSVNSILNQSYSDFELIIIDDGSTDGTSEICDRIKQSDDRVTVIHKANGGLSDARNCGLEIARGEYIVFVDSDDYINLDTCIMFEKYIQNKYDIIVGNIESGSFKQINIFGDNTVFSGVDYLKRVLTKVMYVKAPVWLNIYRRAFINDINLKFPVGYVHEDEYFTPMAFLNADRVIYTKNKFYNNVARKNSITNDTSVQSRMKRYKDSLEIAKILENEYLDIEDEKLKRLMLNSSAGIVMWTIANNNAVQITDISEGLSFISRNTKTVRTKLLKCLLLLLIQFSVFYNNLIKFYNKGMAL